MAYLCLNLIQVELQYPSHEVPAQESLKMQLSYDHEKYTSEWMMLNDGLCVVCVWGWGAGGVRVYLCVGVCVCMRLCLCLCLFLYLCLSMRVCVFPCVCVCSGMPA